MQRWRLAAALVVFVVIACLAGIAVYVIAPPGEPGARVEIIVEPGTALASIAKRLEREKVIVSARALTLWMRMRGLETQVQAGRHMFREHEGVAAAARNLLDAKALFVEATIPEGLTIEQTASRLIEFLSIDSARFVSLCVDSATVAAMGFDRASLEGYLFPETYRFTPSVDAEGVIRRMTGQFRTAFGSLPKTGAVEHMTMHEIVTLASIVEKEATLAAERPRIAGVFHNRLRIGYPLGADPTVRYALRKFSGPLRVSELKNPSPYNTRVHRGLPPGPICSPGLGALRATVSPAETKDLYFVAKWDGTGAHDFSRTLKEHERKKWKIRRENQRRLKQKHH